MDPVVTVDDANVSVEPGGQATVRVRVRNRSSIVEGFRIDVVGEAAGWAQLYPAELEVRPLEEAETVVIFSPPAGIASRAGQVPFGVRAVSQVDPTASAVGEGDLRVGSVALSQATVTPVTSHGRFSGKHRIEMANWGNSSVRLHLEVSDPDETLGFLLVPDVLDLPIGTTGRARLKVRVRKPFFRGMPVRRPFRVVGRPIGPGDATSTPPTGPAPQFGLDPTQPTVDGAFEQRPILGRATVLLVLGAVVAAGVIGWLGTRSDGDPGAERVAPPAPDAFTAQPLSHDTVRLTWQPGERVDSYKVFTVDPATVQDPEPRARDIVDVPGDQGELDMGELEPETQYCFQLAAVRNELTSTRSDAQCVSTLQLSGPGAPAAPTGVTVEAAEEGKVRVSWEDASEGQADHVVIRDGSIVDVVTHPKTETVVDLASGENCFQVQAQLGEVTSPPTDPCVAFAGGGGPGAGGGEGVPVTEPPGGTTVTAPAPLGIIAVVHLIPLEDITPQERAIERRDQLRADGHPADVLDTRDYPMLAGATTNFFYVYVPGFDSIAAAEQFCVDYAFTTCLTYDLSAGASTTTTLPT